MSTSQLYYADKTGAPNSPDGSSNFWNSRRAYGYDNYHGGSFNKNISPSFTRLGNGTTYRLETNQDDGPDWHNVVNMDHMWRTSTGSSYGRIEWNVKSVYRQVIGFGPFFSSSTRSYFHANVIGVTFSFKRDGYLANDNVLGWCGFRNFGSLYYQPSSNRWRAVDWDNTRRITVSGYPNSVYESSSNDRFTWYGTDPTNFYIGSNTSWHSVKAWAGTQAHNYIMNEEWLWGGFYIQAQCTDDGGISRLRRIKFADLQPIYGSHRDSAKLILPFTSATESDLRNSGTRRLR